MKVDVKLVFFKDLSDDKRFSKVIRWWTNSRFAHVEICINGTWIVANGDKLLVSTTYSPEGVFVTKDITANVTKKQYYQLSNWINSISGAKYDYVGIALSLVLPIGWDNPNKWFCSEVTAKILQLLLVNESYSLVPNMVSPGTLAKIFLDT